MVKLGKKSVTAIIIGAIVVVAIACVFGVNAIVNRRFYNNIKENAVSANVLIIKEEKYSEGDSVTHTSYTAGLSGVIFRNDNNKYYALTALHGVKDVTERTDIKLYILGYNQPTFQQSDFTVSFLDYYSQFAVGTVEYCDEEYDLAIISFYSENEYTALEIAKDNLKPLQRVASLGNPYQNERNKVENGFFIGNGSVQFENDGLEYSVIKHTARTSEGSSGGALLNQQLEIVGIVIGGETVLGIYTKGYAMPHSTVLTFINDMDNAQA